MHAPRRMLILETMSRSALCGVHAISRAWPRSCRGPWFAGSRGTDRDSYADMPYGVVCDEGSNLKRLAREFGVRDTDTAPRSALGRSGQGGMQCDCARGGLNRGRHF
jgi:hypothetical protein